MLIEHHNEQQATQAQYESLMIKNCVILKNGGEHKGFVWSCMGIQVKLRDKEINTR